MGVCRGTPPLRVGTWYRRLAAVNTPPLPPRLSYTHRGACPATMGRIAGLVTLFRVTYPSHGWRDSWRAQPPRHTKMWARRSLIPAHPTPGTPRPIIRIDLSSACPRACACAHVRRACVRACARACGRQLRPRFCSTAYQPRRHHAFTLALGLALPPVLPPSLPLSLSPSLSLSIPPSPSLPDWRVVRRVPGLLRSRDSLA